MRRAGYAFRQVYEHFLYRYKMLAAATWPNWTGEAREGVAEILKQQQVPEEEYAFGKTKIFIRNPKLVSDSASTDPSLPEQTCFCLNRFHST